MRLRYLVLAVVVVCGGGCRAPSSADSGHGVDGKDRPPCVTRNCDSSCDPLHFHLSFGRGHSVEVPEPGFCNCDQGCICLDPWSGAPDSPSDFPRIDKFRSCPAPKAR